MRTQPISFEDDRITIDPAVCNGKPTIRGKRITAQTILEFLGAGESRKEILRQYPSLEPEDIDACLAFAAKLMTYVRKANAGPVVVTDAGRPVAALVLLENTDVETVALSTDPEFLDIIQSSRARHTHQGGLSSAEVRRRLKDDVEEE